MPKSFVRLVVQTFLLKTEREKGKKMLSSSIYSILNTEYRKVGYTNYFVTYRPVPLA